MNQREADEYQKRFEEVRRVSALWIESMQAAVSEAVKVKEFAATIVPCNDLWQKSHDDLVAMLDDLSMPEMSMAKIAIAKIKQERKGRAA